MKREEEEEWFHQMEKFVREANTTENDDVVEPLEQHRILRSRPPTLRP